MTAIFVRWRIFRFFGWHSLCSDSFILILSSLDLSALALAFQLFNRNHCLQISGLRMCSVTWNRFPVKQICWFIWPRHPCGDQLFNSNVKNPVGLQWHGKNLGFLSQNEAYKFFSFAFCSCFSGVWITSVFSYLYYKKESHLCFLICIAKKQTHCIYIVCVAAQRLLSTMWGPRCNSLTTAVNIWHTRAKYLT